MEIRNIYSFFTLFLVIGMTISISGCSTLGYKLAQDDAIKIETLKQSNIVEVLSASVYEKNNKLAVFGSIRRIPGSHGRAKGHVNIKVIDPVGKILSEKTVFPRPRYAHSNASTFRFSAYLDMAPPAGSVIQVAAHKGIQINQP